MNNVNANIATAITNDCETKALWSIRMTYTEVYALLESGKIDGHSLVQTEEFCNPTTYRHRGLVGCGEVEIPAFRSLEEERRIALSLEKADEAIEEAKYRRWCETAPRIYEDMYYND